MSYDMCKENVLDEVFIHLYMKHIFSYVYHYMAIFYNRHQA